MTTNEKKRQRFLRDPLPVRLGGLAATLGRISSSAREGSEPATTRCLIEEARHMIEWTAADAEPEAAAELVLVQRQLTLWQNVWEAACQDRRQRVLLSVQAKIWSDRTLALSGLLDPTT